MSRLHEVCLGLWSGVVLGLLAVALASCGSHASASQPPAGVGPPALGPRRWAQTPGGYTVGVPEWLDRAPEKRARCYAQIDASGCPRDYAVWIGNPGLLEAPWSETGLVWGYVDEPNRVVHVAYRDGTAQALDEADGVDDGDLLPALDHEVGHVLHGPDAGH